MDSSSGNWLFQRSGLGARLKAENVLFQSAHPFAAKSGCWNSRRDPRSPLAVRGLHLNGIDAEQHGHGQVDARANDAQQHGQRRSGGAVSGGGAGWRVTLRFCAFPAGRGVGVLAPGADAVWLLPVAAGSDGFARFGNSGTAGGLPAAGLFAGRRCCLPPVSRFCGPGGPAAGVVFGAGCRF